jgi:GNAT superfamily N-acetyltransferase
MSSHAIRPASEHDAAELARLSAQLGYPASEDQIRARLRRLLASPADALLVAASAEGPLLGWIHGALTQLLESDYRVEICGLIIDAANRRRGLGRELVRRLETWAADHGATQSSVRCRTTRHDAHHFYENLGYTLAKTQLTFRKPLA